MPFPQYRKPNGDYNTFRELKHLSESEVRAIVEELTDAYKKTKNSDERWEVSQTLYPYRSALERFEKASRAKAREEKKNSKLAEEQRIKELASSLRINLIPVEKALAQSIIKRKNGDLKDGIDKIYQLSFQSENASQLKMVK